MVGLSAAAVTPIGCGGPDATVVVGVTTDMHAGAEFDQLAYSLSVNGAIVESRTLQALPSTFPLELTLDQLDDEDEVAVDLRAISLGAVTVERLASTRASKGRKVLLRVPLESACRAPAAPTCAAPETCIDGTCAQSFVPPDRLADYTSGWGTSSTDGCKHAGDAPEVVVGAGQADYLPTKDGDVAQVEAGPQGGYHVWIAIRVRGLRQSGSVTTLTGSIPSLGYALPPFSVVFTFDPSEGGACELYGLRFRIDDEAHPVDTLLGKELHVNVEVADTDGTVGAGSRIVQLSNDIL